MPGSPTPTWNINIRRPEIANLFRNALVLGSFEQLGEVGLLFFKTLKNLFRRPREHKILLQQLEEIGVRSLPVVSLTAAFGGLVFGLQTYVGFHRYIGPGSEAYGGPIISLGLSKELIPILVGLMVSGRVGSSMAAEIGTMKITEQIDALFSLGANPVRYLVVPRTVAAFFMLPCLTLYGDIIGIACGYFYNVTLMGVNRIIYLQNTLRYLELWDITSGLLKSAVFGIVIAIVGCWQGLKAEGGAEGVGRATTRTVVLASISILILNFFLSKVLPSSLRG
ncbi:MAG: ABC transporter permease [Candidatus Aminicenantes bacterium]|nr:ABC transporter permease [Candidatus Aminicenantes bacterium]